MSNDHGMKYNSCENNFYGYGNFNETGYSVCYPEIEEKTTKKKFETKQMLIQEKSLENDLLNSSFYFIHSFFVNCKKKEVELGTSLNGKLNFSSIVKKDKVVAFQFHPEKSGRNGLILLNNLVKNFLQ